MIFFKPLNLVYMRSKHSKFEAILSNIDQVVRPQVFTKLILVVGLHFSKRAKKGEWRPTVVRHKYELSMNFEGLLLSTGTSKLANFLAIN